MTEYTARLASGAPAPGGGSAAALAGALGAALGEMVANFTVGKKKYADVEAQVQVALDALTAWRQELLQLTDADATAYAAVGEAYAMPKESDEDKAARTAAIQVALKEAAGVPLRVVHVATSVFDHLPLLSESGNQNLVSDVGVAAKLALVAVECAWLNVEVNLACIKDQDFNQNVRAEVADALDAAREAAARVWDGTVQRVCR